MAKGRKPIEINWEILDALVQFKVTKGFCADYLGVSEDTIEKRIREKFDMTFTEYNNLKLARTGYKLQQKAISLALSGNVTMMIFALKNIANWSDNIKTEHGSDANKPVNIVITQADGKRTLEEIEND